MLDYTAIDFETANAYRGSPCAVGLVRVRNGLAVGQERWLIHPPAAADHFDGFNVSIHGITPEMVEGAPRWNEILPEMLAYIGDDVVVTHNAGFDISVIRYACAADQIAWPSMRFLCTLVLSRRALRLPSYRLPFVIHELGLDIDNHHDPLADAKAVVAIVGGLALREGASDLEKLAEALHVRVGWMSEGSYKGSASLVSRGMGLIPPDINPGADPEGYLYGRVIVFTGTLLSMTRQIAWEESARVGAIPEKAPTKKTQVLVIGDINPAVLRPGSDLTGKARKAFELQARGQDIEVMTEDDFLRCLDAKPLSTLSLT